MLHRCSSKGSMASLSKTSTIAFTIFPWGFILLDLDYKRSSNPLKVSTQEHVSDSGRCSRRNLPLPPSHRSAPSRSFPQTLVLSLALMATSSSDGLPAASPFHSGWDYFVAAAEGLVAQVTLNNPKYLQRKRSGTASNQFATLGPLIFRDIVRDMEIFKSSRGPFHFNYMDMGMQNILIDAGYNFVSSVIDWELAQSAPWDVNHHPMLSPADLLGPKNGRDSLRPRTRGASQRVTASWGETAVPTEVQ